MLVLVRYINDHSIKNLTVSLTNNATPMGSCYSLFMIGAILKVDHKYYFKFRIFFDFYPLDRICVRTSLS